MTVDRRPLAVIAGVTLLALSIVVVLGGRPSPALERWAALLASLVALGAFLIAVRGFRRATGGSSDVGDVFESTVERPATEEAVVGEDLEDAIAEATRRARSVGSVEAGIESIRPTLRETVVAVLVASGESERDALHAVATGQWCDEPEAAALLADRPTPPPRSLSRRLAIWLFPEEALEHRLRITVRVIETLAAERLPTLPGQAAPRTIPVHRRTPTDGPGLILEAAGDAPADGDVPPENVSPREARVARDAVPEREATNRAPEPTVGQDRVGTWGAERPVAQGSATSYGESNASPEGSAASSEDSTTSSEDHATSPEEGVSR